MDRREAITALSSVAVIPSMAAWKADLGPGDVFVVEIPGPVSTEKANEIQATIKSIWPGRAVIVLSDGMRLNIISGV